VLLAVAASLALAACSEGSLFGTSARQQIITYETSLRSEADYLWAAMNYARQYYKPTADWCAARNYHHQPVTMSDAERQKDRSSSYMVDQLDYAALLIGETRDRWTQFCQNGGGASPAPYMEARLRTAYDSLNAVRLTLNPPGPTATPYR
jgi:hypothetical protein